MVPSRSAQSCAVGSPWVPGPNRIASSPSATSRVRDRGRPRTGPCRCGRRLGRSRPLIKHVDAAAQGAEDPVGVADRQQRQRGVAVGDPGVAVGHTVAGVYRSAPVPQGISASSPAAIPCRRARGSGSGRTPRCPDGPCRRPDRAASSPTASWTGAPPRTARPGCAPAPACPLSRCACRSLTGLSGSSPYTRCDMTPRSRIASSASARRSAVSIAGYSAAPTPLRFSPVSTLTVTVAVRPVRLTASQHLAAAGAATTPPSGRRRCSAGAKSVPGGCSHASTGAVMPSRRSASASSMVATPSLCGAGGQRGAGDLGGAVAVTVGLDHRHHLRRAGVLAQYAHVVADGVEVHHRLGGRVRRQDVVSSVVCMVMSPPPIVPDPRSARPT